MRRTLRRRRAGLTMLEVTIAIALFTIVIFGVSTTLQSAGEVASLVHNQTTVQLEAQRVVRLIAEQVERTNTVNTVKGGRFTLTNSGTSPTVWEMSYYRLDTSSDIFDESNFSAPVPWSTQQYTIRCLRSETAGYTDGSDNDGDYLVDEEHIVLLENGTQVAVLGKDLYATVSALDNQARPRFRLTLEVQRLVYGVVKTAADATAAKAGNGPRVRYIYDTWFTLPG